MGARGRRNLKRKWTTKEAIASAPPPAPALVSSEGVDHADDLTKRKNKTPMPTKPVAAAEEEVQPACVGKRKDKEKRKRVVRDRVSEKLIGIMIVHSHSVHDIPDERLAQRSEKFREDYAKSKARSEKMMADEQALIDQYLISGYAEFVWEVTDDEDDGDGTEGDSRYN